MIELDLAPCHGPANETIFYESRRKLQVRLVSIPPMIAMMIAMQAAVDNMPPPEEPAIGCCAAQFELPAPTSDPLRISAASDPILNFLNQETPLPVFQDYVGDAVAANPALLEARAGIAEAEASRREARAGLFPTLDVGLSGRTSLARNFSNDPDNILERSRATGRTDATFALNQTVLDFGGTSIRIAAASARIRAATSELDRQADQVALRAIAAWYDVFTYTALVNMMDDFITRQIELREDMRVRVASGVSSESDIIRVQNLISASESRLAGYERDLANAEARFRELFGRLSPSEIGQPPDPAARYVSAEAARASALDSATVSLVDAQARAALQDARAARTQTLPQVSVGLEGGRFGVFETDNDYDIRATINLTHRFFGTADARADQFEARSRSAAARSERIRSEVARQAAIAWHDVQALEDQFDAVASGYLTARQSRDALLERFRVARGTLFDVLDAERQYVDAATLLVSTKTELSAARYVLLSRTGDLLGTLAIETREESNFRLRGNE